MGLRVAGVGLSLFLVGWLGWRFLLPIAWSDGSAPPVDLAADPEQTPLVPTEQVQVSRGGKKFTIEKLHRYVVTGEVLSATAYDVAWTNDFFDVDVGLLWGPSREAMKQRYSFSQMGRFLFWRTDQPVSNADRDDVTRHISNSHLIPAEGHRHLASAVRWVSKGDSVRIEGYLVRVLDEQGNELLASSVTRDDSGPGACEVIWVDSLQINGRVYR